MVVVEWIHEICAESGERGTTASLVKLQQINRVNHPRGWPIHFSPGEPRTLIPNCQLTPWNHHTRCAPSFFPGLCELHQPSASLLVYAPPFCSCTNCHVLFFPLIQFLKYKVVVLGSFPFGCIILYRKHTYTPPVVLVVKYFRRHNFIIGNIDVFTGSDILIRDRKSVQKVNGSEEDNVAWNRFLLFSLHHTVMVDYEKMVIALTGFMAINIIGAKVNQPNNLPISTLNSTH